MQHGILSCFMAFKQRGSAQYALGNLKLIASYIPPPSKTSNYHHIFKVVCLGACTFRAGYADIAFLGGVEGEMLGSTDMPGKGQ